jgi:HAD superfamily hydrolase (TIGR01459 family)
VSDIAILTSIAPLAGSADAWISDIWGVLHNGAVAFPAAGQACVRFRAQGGRIALVTNAPYSASEVGAMLDRLGVPRGAYDAIVSSGDVTRDLIRPWAGRPVFHLGPDRYLSVFEGLGITLCDADAAEVVVCSGLLHDEEETPADYAGLLARLRARNLQMICVNPDIIVERGRRIVYCAGALAEAYEALGGDVVYAGKPHPPIYERARARIDDLCGGAVAGARILAIGDGVRTDMRGAARAGLRSVFIASALHFGHGDRLDPATLDHLFANEPARPIAAMQALAW